MNFSPWDVNFWQWMHTYLPAAPPGGPLGHAGGLPGPHAGHPGEEMWLQQQRQMQVPPPPEVSVITS